MHMIFSVENDAMVSLCNKSNMTPLNMARPKLAKNLKDLAQKFDKSVEPVPYQRPVDDYRFLLLVLVFGPLIYYGLIFETSENLVWPFV